LDGVTLTAEPTIFTNGCFDIIHIGHVQLLEFCASLGRVVVGLNSDASVKRLKGPTRPINNEIDRKMLLLSIKYVDEVLIFEEDTPYALIQSLKPKIIVKGGDYEAHAVVGSDLAEVRLFPYQKGHSTTEILRSLPNN
jgi:D-beta-D-heptose 7-phosphate kinase/D-beta-D-heptose 1-phosphate adenosyltransferase